MKQLIGLLCIVGCLAASPAFAQVSLSASASTDSGASASDDSSAPAAASDAPASPGYGSEADTWEVGLLFGLFMPSAKHELYDPDGSKPRLGHHKLEKVTPELGLRAEYLPWRVLGIEAEAVLLPSQTRDTNQGVNIFALRGHLMLAAPTDYIVPFLVVGGGLLGVSSEDTALGSETDLAMHVGLGAKAYVTRELALRLDVRDNLSNGTGKGKAAMHWEALLGFSLVAGRAALPPPPPPDSDGDGIDDAKDKCKDASGPAPDGCPPPPDADGDGVPDATDACPNAAGPADATDEKKNGCPPPPPDADGDGVPDATDACPQLAGDAANGCIADEDGDGIRDTEDKCAKEPETKNGFEDKDGCPDELPEAVKKFTGVIEGIVFDANKATIRPTSFAKLDEAVKVLTEFVELRMEISGHSDTSGNAEKNTQLSKERAESVKAYFVSKGVAAERVEAVGMGSSAPIADNATKDGRAKNRRIEFKVLQ
jgi:outer membrane protein OmpA-like peptidoglycan-associated protein